MSLNKRKLQQTITDPNRTGFIAIPNELLHVLAGEPAAFMVWTYIYGQAESWQPSIRQIAKALGLVDKTVQKALKFLEDRNLLIIHSGDYCHKNEYELTDISEWKYPE